MGKIGKILLALLVVWIAFTLLFHLFFFGIKIAILGAIVYGIIQLVQKVQGTKSPPAELPQARTDLLIANPDTEIAELKRKIEQNNN